MTTVAESLPLLAGTSPLPGLAVWQRELALADRDLVKQIAVATSAGQSHVGESLFEWSNAVRREMLSLVTGARTQVEKEAIEVLLFNLAILPLQVATGQGRLDLTYDWLVESVSDHTVPTGPATGLSFELKSDRVVRLVRSRHPALADYLPHTGTDWLGVFFYYERLKNTAPEIAAAAFSACTPWILDQLAHYREAAGRENGQLDDALERTLTAAMMMADWAFVQGEPAGIGVRHLVAALEASYDSSDVPDRARASVGVFLTGPASSLTDVRPPERARDVLRHFAEQLLMHERLQVSIVSWGSDIPLHVDELVSEIRDYRSSLAGVTGDHPITGAYSESRLAGLLNLPLLQLTSHGAVSDAVRTLAAWHGIDRRVRSSLVLLLTPTVEGAPVAAVDGETLFCPHRDADTRIAAVTAAADAFLGTTTTLSFRSGYRPAVPRRLGVPEPDAGGELERQVNAYYELEEVGQRAPFQEASAILAYPGSGLPIQSVMCKTLGWTLPLAASLQEPAEDRPPQRVLIYPVGTTTVELEVDAIRSRLAAAVEVFPSGELGREAFMDVYSDPAYDVIWVISHGAYEHYTPHNASILVREGVFGQGEVVRLPELASIGVPGDRRRLLVLNVCDGGVAASLGGLNRLGLGPMLAGRNQAVISHLWPVNALAAAALGALLANELGAVDSFFGAYSSALRALRGMAGRTGGGAPPELPAPLTERLARASVDTASLAWWGSAAFFE